MQDPKVGYPSKFRPLLSATLEDLKTDLKRWGGALYASPKVDGIRVLCHPILGPVTRSLKPVPNKYIRSILADPNLWGFDGEIVVGNLTSPNTFNQTTSGVMSEGGTPDFRYWAFDQFWDPVNGWDEVKTPYVIRLDRMKRRADFYADFCYEGGGFCRVNILEHEVVDEEDSTQREQTIEFLEEGYLERGFEGLMIRQGGGPYKLNRSTLREGTLVKVKRFVDDEAEIVGFEELTRNTNDATKNALGYTERSSHNHGKVAANTLGALVVSAAPWGTFNIGSGFDAATRDRLWADRDSLVGRIVKFKHQKVGQVDKPRFPIFLGFRED